MKWKDKRVRFLPLVIALSVRRFAPCPISPQSQAMHEKRATNQNPAGKDKDLLARTPNLPHLTYCYSPQADNAKQPKHRRSPSQPLIVPQIPHQSGTGAKQPPNHPQYPPPPRAFVYKTPSHLPPDLLLEFDNDRPNNTLSFFSLPFPRPQTSDLLSVLLSFRYLLPMRTLEQLNFFLMFRPLMPLGPFEVTSLRPPLQHPSTSSALTPHASAVGSGKLLAQIEVTQTRHEIQELCQQGDLRWG